MIDISDIHMIKVIIEVGSINRAAELLHVSQPTLSKKISRLEKKVNLELFNRHNAGMIPTEAAKFLLQEGAGLQEQLGAIERKLQLMSDMVGGQVRIGVGPIVEQIILPKVLLDFAESDYRFSISVITDTSESLLKQLKNSEIDLAIGPFELSDIKDDFEAVLSASEKLVGTVRAGHDLIPEEGANVILENALKYKLITPDIPKHIGSHALELLKSAKVSPNIVCDNYSMVKTVVANSDYGTIGPESLFRSEIESGELVKLNYPIEMHWQCACLVKPEMLLMPVVKEVVSLFSQYMQPIK